VLPTPDLHKDFIYVEGIAVALVSALQTSRISGAKLDAPQTNRLIADDNAALSQKILDVAGTQIEPMVEPNGVLNDLGRKSVAFVKRCGSIHLAIVALPPLTCQYPGARHVKDWPPHGRKIPVGASNGFRMIR